MEVGTSSQDTAIDASPVGEIVSPEDRSSLHARPPAERRDAAHRPGTAGRWPSNTFGERFAWLFPAAVFTVCAFARNYHVFLNPRFWAEEGSLYYADMQHLGWMRALFSVQNGNFQLATNLIVEAALQVRARYAAYVTTDLAWLVACYCCVLIGRFMAHRSCSLTAIAVACGLFALQVSGYEVLLNATNVQWVCSVVTLFMVLDDDVPASSPAAIRRYILTVLLGLTGVTSCILLPVVLIGAMLRRTRFRWVMLALLLLTALIQFAIVALHSPNAGRSFTLGVDYLVPLAMQGVLANLLPPALLDAIGGQLTQHGHAAQGLGFQVTLVGLAGLFAVAALAKERLGTRAVLLLVAAIVLCTLVNEFGALGSVDDFMSSYGGSRYFFLASTCFIVMAAAGLSSRSPWRRGGATLVVVLMVSNAILNGTNTQFTSIFFTGASLAAQVKACAAVNPCSVYAWPDADYTRFQIDGAR